MHTDEHFREIFRAGIARIQACDCGMVHLGIGPVTVKLTPEAFTQALQAMLQAERLMNEAAGRPAVPSLRLVDVT